MRTKLKSKMASYKRNGYFIDFEDQYLTIFGPEIPIDEVSSIVESTGVANLELQITIDLVEHLDKYLVKLIKSKADVFNKLKKKLEADYAKNDNKITIEKVEPKVGKKSNDQKKKPKKKGSDDDDNNSEEEEKKEAPFCLQIKFFSAQVDEKKIIKEIVMAISDSKKQDFEDMTLMSYNKPNETFEKVDEFMEIVQNFKIDQTGDFDV